MSQCGPFKIKIPETCLIDFDQDDTFENFIGQFQPVCSKLICIIDGTILRYYDKPGSIPKNIRFDYKQHKRKITEYYFRDIGTDSLYCVFGRPAALIFYPRLDEVDPMPVEPRLPVHVSEIDARSQPRSHSEPTVTPDALGIRVLGPIPSLLPPGRQISAPEPRHVGRGRAPIIRPIQPPPSEIVVVDEGVKLTFPNPNYPVALKLFQPTQP
jgi:hypothetical protein